MKSNELRVGNIVYDRGSKIIRIDYFEHPKVCQRIMVGGFEVHPMTEYITECKPIPLTGDWLIKCGFKNLSSVQLYGYYSLHIGNMLLLTSNGVYEFGINTEEKGAIQAPAPQIKYVHQLQNLYFALTGEELNIKDKV